MKCIYDFMESPLVIWAKSLLVNESKLNYDQFPNGQYFFQILKQCDQRIHNSNMPNEGEPFDTTRSRLLNLDFVLRNIRSFYQEVLNHILLIKLPDIYEIARHPESEETFKEMEKILLLLLGVAINGNLKETFIEQIQTKLNTQTQINLVPYIQLVTDDINFCLSKSIFLQLKANQAQVEESNNNSQKFYTDMKSNDMTNATANTMPTASNYVLSAVHSNDANELAFCVSTANHLNSSNVNAVMNNLMVSSMSKSLVDSCAHREDAQQQAKSASICFNSLDQLNYFVNNKLMSNIQRIVDERDSYLESIIELQQDKEYLSYKLSNSSAINANSLPTDSNGQQSSQEKKTSINEFILNSNLAELIRASDEQSTTQSAQSATRANGQAHQMLNLIELIFKHLRTSSFGKVSANSESDELNATSCENLIESILSQMVKLDLSGQASSSNGNANQSIAIELVECKIKLKQLINEIEEKCEQIETLRCEIDDVRKQVNKLRNENVELQQKAALANVYSDELESLRDKSIKSDKYESDIVKLRERIDELQSNEMRLNELKDENVILIETRALMEKQLNEYQVRLLSMQRLDNDLNKYKVEIDDLMHQRELDKRRLCELCEKNAKLELEMRNLLNQNISMDEELNYFKQQCTFMTAELGKQQQALSVAQQSLQSKEALLNETTKLKKIEADNVSNELNSQVKARDQEVSKLKESLRAREITLAEQVAQIKVLSEQLSIEQENKIKCERTLEQHKSEIKELQLKLDDCVSETRKLDASIRAAAQNNEQKESENQENFKKLIQSHEELNESYKKLLIDHEQLQKIYLQLEADYDEMYNELATKHSQINSLNGELDELKQQNGSLVIKCARLDTELNGFKSKTYTHQAVLTDEHEANRKDIELFYEHKFDSLNAEIGQLQTKRETVETKLKELSEQLAASACENDNLREQVKSKDKSVESSQLRIEQLNERIQTLETMNDKLDDEKHQLFEQLHLLLQQNQEILTQTLNSKEMFHEETKAYLHQLNNLKRQKEMLEQKIMEHYKNTPSQKQKNTTNNHHNLMDMFSSKTRQLVQKVRNKSSSTTSQSECNSKSSNDLTNEIDKAKMPAFCHKYSADDVNYLTIQPKLDTTTHGSSTSKQQIVSCLSSSSTSSSSSSSSSSCIPDQTSSTATAHEQLNGVTPTKESTSGKLLVANGRQTANNNNSNNNNNNNNMKLDPKSLKLGRRPVSICSSTCSSPVPLTSSPTTVSMNHSRTPNHLDVSRNLMSKFVNQSPTSSCSSSTYSSASLLSKVITNQTPPYRPNALMKDATPISALITKKPNLNSIQLLNSSPINAGKPLVSTGKSQRITARIADSLSKLRTSSDIANNYEDINDRNEQGDDDDDDDDAEDENEQEEDEDEHVKKYTNLCKDARLNASANSSSSSKQHSANKTSNEIWLEYGCI